MPAVCVQSVPQSIFGIADFPNTPVDLAMPQFATKLFVKNVAQCNKTLTCGAIC